MSLDVSADTSGRTPPEYVMEHGADTWRSWKQTASLLKHLTRRHLAARYRGSTLGFLWSLLNPVMMMLVYTFVFQYLLRVSTPGIPYPVFFLTGLLAWNFVQVGTLNSATSILDNATLINKAYFPRFTLPVSAVLSNGANYLVSIPLLIVFNLIMGMAPGMSFLLLPLVLAQILVLSIGLALIGASLTPFFRDLIQLLDVLFVAWFFASPIIYPPNLPQDNLSEAVHAVYQLNPMVGMMSMVRGVFLSQPVPTSDIVSCSVGSLLILGIGILVFRRYEPRFASAA